MSENLKRRDALRWMAAGAAISALPPLAQAQVFPSKPVRLMVGAVPGGPADFMGRLYGEAAAAALGQPFVVENRPGVAGTIAATVVAKTGQDGYTVLAASPATMVMAPYIFPKLDFDAEKDFVPVAMLGAGGFVLVAHPSLPVNNVAELIAYAKARPRTLNYGSGGPGSSSHVYTEAFLARAGIEVSHVPYKGDAQGIIDLVGGQIQLMCVGNNLAIPHMKTGKLKALAVTSLDRVATIPDVPAVHETLPGFEQISWMMIFAHSAVPAADLDRLASGWSQARQQPAIKSKLEAFGMSPADRYATRASLPALLRSEHARLKPLIQKLAITPT